MYFNHIHIPFQNMSPKFKFSLWVQTASLLYTFYYLLPVPPHLPTISASFTPPLFLENNNDNKKLNKAIKENKKKTKTKWSMQNIHAHIYLWKDKLKIIIYKQKKSKVRKPYGTNNIQKYDWVCFWLPIYCLAWGFNMGGLKSQSDSVGKSYFFFLFGSYVFGDSSCVRDWGSCTLPSHQ